MIKKYYYRHIDEIIENKNYFILSLFLSIYVFSAQLIIFESKRQLLATFISIFVLFILSKLSKYLFVLVSIFVLIITSMVLHITLLWGSGSLSERLQAALLSPKYEVIEYVANYSTYIDFIILGYVSLGLYLLCRHILKCNQNYKICKITGLFILIMFFVAVFNTNYIQRVAPYRYIPKLISAGEWKEVIDQRFSFLNNLKLKKYVLPEGAPGYDKIVIVIGESVNKYHMSVYGYEDSTTPFLEKLLKENNSFKFNNVISSANQTRYSLPISLTNMTATSFADFAKSKSIVSVFKEYGFKTYWLSNQYMAGMHDSYIASIASEADFTITTNYVYERGGGAHSEFDMVLVDYLDDLDVNNSNKEVYYIHMLGSHFQYKMRYPKGAGLYPSAENIIEEYDNSIYYSDLVLSRIFEKFRKTKSLFIYLSDHGEVVSEKVNGHGFIPSYRDEYDVPLIIHSSINNDRIVNLKIINEVNLFNTENFNHLVQYLVGIEDDVEKILNSTAVIDVDLENILNYNNIKRYKSEL